MPRLPAHDHQNMHLMAHKFDLVDSVLVNTLCHVFTGNIVHTKKVKEGRLFNLPSALVLICPFLDSVVLNKFTTFSILCLFQINWVYGGDPYPAKLSPLASTSKLPN